VADPRENELSAQILQLAITRVGPAVLVSVTGEIDILTAPRLAEAMNTAFDDIEAGAPVVVDLSRVSFLDSHGLATLSQTSSTASPATDDARLRLVVGDARRVIRPLQISGLDKMLPIYATVGDALAGTTELP
jgi:anti-sigma B factor antagonist